MKTKIWTRHNSVLRPGLAFYTADIVDRYGPRRINVHRSTLSNRWVVNDTGRELPATWATATEAKFYAEQAGEFGRFA